MEMSPALMNMPIKTLMAALSLLWLLSVSGCGCGFDCNNGNNPGSGPALLTLGLSDALPEQLKQVVIEVDRITFRRSGGNDVVVEEFVIDGAAAQDSFQVDLLQYQGRNQLIVIEDLELAVASYSEVLITLLVDDINLSYVQEADDSIKLLTTASSGLSVPGMSLASGSSQYTVEFSLAQSLQYRSGSDSYLLASDGIRTEDNAVAASLSGRVDSSLFDSVEPCDSKPDPEAGNRIYLYQGTGLSAQRAADVFTDASTEPAPEDARAPFTVAALARDSLTGSWRYAVGFLPPDDYTMAFACDTETDDAVEFDDLTIPLPSEQLYEISLDDSENAVCDLGPSADCTL